MVIGIERVNLEFAKNKTNISFVRRKKKTKNKEEKNMEILEETNLIGTIFFYLSIVNMALASMITIHHMIDPPSCGIFFYRILPGFDACYLLVGIFGLVATKVNTLATYTFLNVWLFFVVLVYVVNLW